MWFLNMSKTSLNAKHRVEGLGLGSFQSVLARDLAYWDPLSLQIVLMKHIFLIGIHSMQSSTATTRHGVTRNRSTKRLEHTENIFRKNMQVIVVC